MENQTEKRLIARKQFVEQTVAEAVDRLPEATLEPGVWCLLENYQFRFKLNATTNTLLFSEEFIFEDPRLEAGEEFTGDDRGFDLEYVKRSIEAAVRIFATGTGDSFLITSPQPG